MANEKWSALTKITNPLLADEIGILKGGVNYTTTLTYLKALITTIYLNVVQEWTAAQNFNATELIDAASIVWDVSANQVCSVTLEGNRTLANPTNMKDGAVYVLTVKQDATAPRLLAYDTAYKFPGGVVPVLSTTNGAVDILSFISDGVNMYGAVQKDYK